MSLIYQRVQAQQGAQLIRQRRVNIPDKKKLIEIANLEIDCKIGKDRHFIAADRKNKWRIYLGLFAVIGSAIISSGIGQGAQVLGGYYIANKVEFSAWAGAVKHVLPLLVGISTAVIGFLGLEKQTTQHRAVGNAYIEIARKARSILNSVDSSNYEAKLREYERLVERYLEINKEGESCPTNDRDSAKAMSMNSKKRAAIKRKISEYENSSLGITDPKPTVLPSLRRLITRSLKVRAATVLTLVGLIRKSDYRNFLKKI